MSNPVFLDIFTWIFCEFIRCPVELFAQKKKKAQFICVSTFSVQIQLGLLYSLLPPANVILFWPFCVICTLHFIKFMLFLSADSGRTTQIAREQGMCRL